MRKTLILILMLMSQTLLASHQYNLLPRACLTNDYLAFNRWSGGNIIEIVYWKDSEIFTQQVMLKDNSDITMEFQCSDDTIKIEHVVRVYPTNTFFKSMLNITNISKPFIESTIKDESHIKANSNIEIGHDTFKSQEVKKSNYTYKVYPEYISTTNCSPKHNLILSITDNKKMVITKKILTTFQKESDCN